MTRATSNFLSSAILSGAFLILAVGQGAAALAQPYPAANIPNVPGIPDGISQTFSPLPPEVSNTNALNWAGYVSSGGTYTSVSGSWIVPTVAGSAENAADATWVGIGGVASTDLIQAGTEALPTSDGRLQYQAWFEVLPQNSQRVPLAISPGDSVSVSITEAGSREWLISFDNTTTGQTYETTVAYDSSRSSAEWIEEMPVEVGGVIGLDDFGSVNFSGGYTIENGQGETIAGSNATALTMDNAAGEAIATPSQLGTGGASFTVSRTQAQATPLVLTPGGVRAVPLAGVPDSPDVSGTGAGYGYAGHSHHRGFGRSRTFIIQLTF